MQRPWLLAALLPLTGIGGSEARFVAAPLRAGQKVSVTAASALSVHVAVKYRGKTRKEIEFPGRVAFHCAASVTQVDEAGCSAGQITFGKAQEVDVDELGGDPKTREPDYSRRAYDVARGEGGLAIVSNARTRPSRREQEVADWIARATLGAPPLGGWLAGRTLRTGDVIDLPASVADAVIGLLATDATVKALRLTLAETRAEGGRELAVFTAAAALVTKNREEAPFSITVELAGQVTVDRASGLVVALRLEGPVDLATSIEQDGRTLELDGRGTWTIEYAARIE